MKCPNCKDDKPADRAECYQCEGTGFLCDGQILAESATAESPVFVKCKAPAARMAEIEYCDACRAMHGLGASAAPVQTLLLQKVDEGWESKGGAQ